MRVKEQGLRLFGQHRDRLRAVEQQTQGRAHLVRIGFVVVGPEVDHSSENVVMIAVVDLGGKFLDQTQ